MKLKTRFKGNVNNRLITEEQIAKPQKKKKAISNKSHHTMLTYIEATQRELENEQKKMKEKP